MAMEPLQLAGMGLAAVNAVLLAVLTAVWVRNYRQFRTRLLLGLVAFGSVLLIENLVAVYFFFSMHSLYSMDPGVDTVVAVMRGLETLAIAFLTYVTVK